MAFTVPTNKRVETLDIPYSDGAFCGLEFWDRGGGSEIPRRLREY